VLATVAPSPVVELSRAIAVAMRDGPERGLERLDALEARRDLSDRPLLVAARADLLRPTGPLAEAAGPYRRAIPLAANDGERRFLERRRHGVTGPNLGDRPPSSGVASALAPEPPSPTAFSAARLCSKSAPTMASMSTKSWTPLRPIVMRTSPISRLPAHA
jgi:hypothetical protein